jgi:hypothetical protein
MDGNRVPAIRVISLRNRLSVFNTGDTTSVTVTADIAAATSFKEFGEANRYLQDRYVFDTITLR